MNIAFFDLGTTCGYAVGKPRNITSGDWDLKPTRFESWGMRLIKFRRRLESLHDIYQLKAIGYEEVHRHMGTDAAHCYGAYLGVLQVFCLEKDIPFEGVPVGTIKKFWTGKGSANKSDMIAAAHTRGFEPASDNEADALAGLHWLFAQVEKPRPLSSPQEAAE